MAGERASAIRAEVRTLEQALAVGMDREGREVFVTAFVRQGVVAR